MPNEPVAVPMHLIGLTAKQRAFVEHFLEFGNQTQAALAAGYGGPDGSGAPQRGHELMRIDKVRDAINLEQMQRGQGLRSLSLSTWKRILESPDHSAWMLKLKMAAAKEIADRFGMPKSSKSETTVKHQFSNMTDEEIQAFVRSRAIAHKIIDITPVEELDAAVKEVQAIEFKPEPTLPDFQGLDPTKPDEAELLRAIGALPPLDIGPEPEPEGRTASKMAEIPADLTDGSDAE